MVVVNQMHWFVGKLSHGGCEEASEPQRRADVGCWMHVILLLVFAASARHIFLQQAVQLWPYRAQRKIYPVCCYISFRSSGVIFIEKLVERSFAARFHE